MIAQFTEGRTVISALGKVVPHRVAVAVLHRLLNRDPEKIFPAHFHRCWASAIRESLADRSSSEVIPFHRGAAYFHFVKPVRAGYLMLEEWMERRGHEDYAAYYIVDAVK